jgi:hypothetical protein
MDPKGKIFYFTNDHKYLSKFAVITCSKSASWMLPTHTRIISHPLAGRALNFTETTSGGICHKQLLRQRVSSLKIKEIRFRATTNCYEL